MKLNAGDESNSLPNEVRDCGLYNNRVIVYITKCTHESIQVEWYTKESETPHVVHHIKETTLVKFHYPQVMLVKG